jgi:hypothetical protein
MIERPEKSPAAPPAADQIGYDRAGEEHPHHAEPDYENGQQHKEDHHREKDESRRPLKNAEHFESGIMGPVGPPLLDGAH